MNNKDTNLWQLIINDEFSKNNLNLVNFRSEHTNFNRFCDWGPNDKTHRYYKSLMLEMCYYLDDRYNKLIPELDVGDLHQILNDIGRINLGSPTTICYKGLDVSLDYLFCVEEVYFLHTILQSSVSVTEIGGGYGRTAHAIISLYSDIEVYNIIDLPEVLDISRQYLREVLSNKLFRKLKFIPTEEFLKVAFSDIIINIDSMQEMHKDIICQYLNWIPGNCNNFFSKNAICKYDPSIIGVDVVFENQKEEALKSGLCIDIFDIYNPIELELARSKYRKLYCPNDFSLSESQRGFGQYGHFELSLFTRNT